MSMQGHGFEYGRGPGSLSFAMLKAAREVHAPAKAAVQVGEVQAGDGEVKAEVKDDGPQQLQAARDAFAAFVREAKASRTVLPVVADFVLQRAEDAGLVTKLTYSHPQFRSAHVTLANPSAVIEGKTVFYLEKNQRWLFYFSATHDLVEFNRGACWTPASVLERVLGTAYLPVEPASMDLFTALSLGRMPLSKQALGALLADARKLRKKTVKRVHGVIDATQLPQALAQMVVAYAFAGIGEDAGGDDEDSGAGARASGAAAAGKPSGGAGVQRGPTAGVRSFRHVDFRKGTKLVLS